MDEKIISHIMNELVDSAEMSAGVLLVSRGNRLVYKDKWGFMDIDKKKPVAYNTIFRIMSMTKIVTAVGILKLIEQRKTELDQEIKKYLPLLAGREVASQISFGNMISTVRAERELTIRDLLTHSSGFGTSEYGQNKAGELCEPGDTLETRVNRWSALLLDFQPGMETGYSPFVAFDILGRIIEIISGEPFDDFIKKAIFQPLEMLDTGFRISEEQKERLIPLFCTIDGELVDVTDTLCGLNSVGFMESEYISASAGLYSTAEDYHHFTQMLCACGQYKGTNILKPETVAMIYRESAYKVRTEPSGFRWGLGVRVCENPKRSSCYMKRGIYGWSGAFGTHMFVYPEKNLCATFMMNHENIGGADSYIIKRIESLILEIWGS